MEQIKIGLSYARYSSSKQDKGLSIDAQHAYNRKFASLMDIEIHKQYSDRAKTGRNFKREEINQLKRVAKQYLNKGYEVYVFIYDVSRLGRNTVGNLQFRTELQELGIKTYITSDNTDISDYNSNFVFGIKSLLAEQFSLDHGRTTSRGMQQAFELGYLPLAKMPFGYDKVTLENNRKTGKPNKDALLLKDAYLEYMEKGTEKRLLWNKYLPQVPRSSFYEMFKPHRLIFYSGRIPRPMKKSYKRIVDGKHDGIITIDQCDKLIRLYDFESERTNDNKSYFTSDEYREIYWLKGFIWHKETNKPYTSSPTSKPSKNRITHYYKPQKGKGKSLPVDKVHDVLMLALNELRLDDDTYKELKIEATKQLKQQQKDVRKAIHDSEKDLMATVEKIKQLDENFDSYSPKIYERLLNNLESKKEQINKDIEKNLNIIDHADTTMLQVLDVMRSISNIVKIASVDYRLNIVEGIFGSKIEIDINKKIVRTAYLNPIVNIMCLQSDDYKHIEIVESGFLTENPTRGTIPNYLRTDELPNDFDFKIITLLFAA